MKQQVNLEIMDFVEKQILPKYNAFGESHGLRHVTRVIRNSLKLVPVTGADIDMVYVIAAYHDLGMSGPRAIHHITSGKILQADSRLKRWFNKEQIKIMKEAVEEGVNLFGYTTWGCIDLVSAGTGEMRKRYGFIYVDKHDDGTGTMARSKKDSFYWYKKVIASQGEDLD